MADVEMRYPEGMIEMGHAGRLVAPGGVAPRAMPTAEARRLRGSTAESRAAMRSPEGVFRHALGKRHDEPLTMVDVYALIAFARNPPERRSNTGPVSNDYNPRGITDFGATWSPDVAGYVRGNYQALVRALDEGGVDLMRRLDSEHRDSVAREASVSAYTPGPGEPGPQSMPTAEARAAAKQAKSKARQDAAKRPQNPRMGPVKRKHGGGY
jgi:hypothetical protein